MTSETGADNPGAAAECAAEWLWGVLALAVVWGAIELYPGRDSIPSLPAFAFGGAAGVTAACGLELVGRPSWH